jgi:glycosyltransferase involved in cell wall biosynthesis
MNQEKQDAPAERCKHRIGFIATRIAGTDGVSLETRKWAEQLSMQECGCFYFAGELDTPEDRSCLVEKAHFKHPEILSIYNACFGRRNRPPEMSAKIEAIKNELKEAIRDFIDRFNIDLVIAENVLSLPLNIPLALALTEVIAETCIPTIGHHHDFYWERQRMLVSAAWDYVNKAFPPHMPSVWHVVINSSAAHQLALRAGVASTLVPNVLDFDHPPEPPGEYAGDVRREIGLEPGQLFVLQPTRVVARKGIEHAIELVHRLGQDAHLVISHAPGDEEREYKKRVEDYASLLGVDCRFAYDRISSHRGRDADGRKIYALEDVYAHADLVTYPSITEGFGNAFLETLYYRQPIVVNTYSVYTIDIKPKGFQAIEIDRYVTDQTVHATRRILEDADAREEMIETNYQLGKKYYSYTVLADRLRSLVTESLGR